MRIALVALVMFAGCDRVYGLTGRTDASPADVSTTDAPCTPGAFDPAHAVPIPPFPQGTYDPTISANGLEMYYVVQPVDPAGTLQLRYATRSTLLSPWETGQEIVGASASMADDVDPTITEDGRSLLFVTTRDTGLFARVVYEMTRTAPGAKWSKPTRLMGIALNAHSIDVSADGRVLFVMTSDDENGMLYRFQRPDIGMNFIGVPSLVGTGMRFPTVSRSEEELYFHDDAGIKRAIKDAGRYVVDPEPLVPGHEGADLSHDGMRLMYQTDTGIAYIERECKEDQ